MTDTVTTTDSFSVSGAAPWTTRFSFKKYAYASGYEHSTMTIGSGNTSTEVEMNHKGLMALAEAAIRMAEQLQPKYDRVEWWTRDGKEVPHDYEQQCDSSED